MHLASGDINVQRSCLPEGTEASVDATAAKMMEMAHGIYGVKSAKIRALSINVVNARNAPDKDYWAYAEAVHEWVRDNIRYVYDPVGQETLSYPEETAFNSKAGDCDDKTILEIAMLGSLGIRAWPVVIGVTEPGVYSHVYLMIQLPPGRYQNAGKNVPADPIMREWPLGKEAPASRVKARKEYPQLAGLPMSIKGYAEGPAYINEEDTLSAENDRRRALSEETGGDAWAMRSKVYDGSDRMFAVQPATVLDLSNRGPLNQATAVATHRRLNVAGVVRNVDGQRPELKSTAVVQSANSPTKNGVQGIGEIFRGFSGEDEVAALASMKTQLLRTMKARESKFLSETEVLKQRAQQGSTLDASKLNALERAEQKWRDSALSQLQDIDRRAKAVAADPMRKTVNISPREQASLGAMAAVADSATLKQIVAKGNLAKNLAGDPEAKAKLLAAGAAAKAELVKRQNGLRHLSDAELKAHATRLSGDERPGQANILRAVREELSRRGQPLHGLGGDSVVPTDSPKDDPSAPPVFRRMDIQGGVSNFF